MAIFLLLFIMGLAVDERLKRQAGGWTRARFTHSCCEKLGRVTHQTAIVVVPLIKAPLTTAVEECLCVY